MKRSLSVIFTFTLFVFLIACGDGSVLQGEDNLSPEELLEKAQQPLKQTKGFAYDAKGKQQWNFPSPSFITYSHDVRANNEPFVLFTKETFSLSGYKEQKREQYLIKNRLYTHHEEDGSWHGNRGHGVLELGLIATSPYDLINQTSNLLSMLKKGKINTKDVFKVRHKDGMYILEFTSNLNANIDSKTANEVRNTVDDWFKKEFKLLLFEEGYADEKYIDQHPEESFFYIDNFQVTELKQSMLFDDKTFVLKKVSREINNTGLEDFKTTITVKGTISEKVALPQEVIDSLE